jgi:hypothetical protein
MAVSAGQLAGCTVETDYFCFLYPKCPEPFILRVLDTAFTHYRRRTLTMTSGGERGRRLHVGVQRIPCPLALLKGSFNHWSGYFERTWMIFFAVGWIV